MPRRTKNTAHVPAGNVRTGTFPIDATVKSELIKRLAETAHYTVGDQVAPCAILWPDESRTWESIIDELKRELPELYVLGPYDAENKTGPAVWLRCVETHAVDHEIPEGKIPIFYLPGISRQQLREIEDLPVVLQPLAELQFRGVVWAHPNGRDWTPLGFLSSDRGGLGLEIVRDDRTNEALQRALSLLLQQPVNELAAERLDEEYFDNLLNPDLPSQILRWMHDQERFRLEKDANAWKAFCRQCDGEYHFHPDKDGPLKAAELLGDKAQKWADVWRRFEEAPQRYTGIIELLEKADPNDRGVLPSFSENWPKLNAQKERELADALAALKDKGPKDVAAKIIELEKQHGVRRQWLWAELGMSQLAQAMEHIAFLAHAYEQAIGGPSAEGVAESYVSDGWRVDAATVDALACCTKGEHENPVIAPVRTLYLAWLDQTARHLQQLATSKPASVKPRLGPVEVAPGKVIVFADALRVDLVRRLQSKLQGYEMELEWDWSPFPPVTPTAKPYVSPVAKHFVGKEVSEEFAVTIESSGYKWTQDRFENLLKENDIQFLKGQDTGDPSGRAWTECGKLDARGHDEGWRLAKLMDQETNLLAERILQLLDAGWNEVMIVTDHGFLLLPGGLPKVELSKHLVIDRWGRCATLKDGATSEMPQLPWFWNDSVSVVSPYGVGCFKAGVEYVHGGISPQELIVPRLIIKRSAVLAQPKISEVKWVGLRCRVTVNDAQPDLLVDIRTRPAAKETSRVEGHQPRELTLDRTVSLPIADTADEGMAAVIVLLSADGNVLHSLPTEIGVNK